MRKSIILLSIILLAGATLWSCIGRQDIFTIKGEFSGLSEAELYFWTPRGGHEKLDTVYVHEGRFRFESPQQEDGWYTLLFQNMNEQVIFAEPGLTVNLEADATHLRSMKIEGGEANKLMTQFRKSLGSETQTMAIARQAATFIGQHPESIVSHYLFQKYYVQQPEVSFQETLRLLDILLKAQPDNGQLKALKQTAILQEKVQVGKQAPDFQVKDNSGRERTLSQYKDSTLLLCFWSNWQTDSRDDLRPLHNKQKEWKKKVAILTLSLDLNRISWRTTLRVDTVPGSHVCDLRAWESPIVKDYGILELPTYVLIDKQHKVIAKENSLDKISEKLIE